MRSSSSWVSEQAARTMSASDEPAAAGVPATAARELRTSAKKIRCREVMDALPNTTGTRTTTGTRRCHTMLEGSSAAIPTGTDQVQPVPHRGPARLARERVHRPAHRRLDGSGDRHVLDGPAVRADQVVVMTGKVLGELIATELLLGEDPADDLRSLERNEVAIDGALGEPPSSLQHLRQRQRASRAGEDVDEPAPLGRVALSVRVQSRRDDRVEVGAHAPASWEIDRGAVRFAIATTAKIAAATRTIAPPGAMFHARPTA